MLITETFAFCFAHHLPTFPEGHKCRRVHGHTAEVHVTVRVPDGLAVDHALLRKRLGAHVHLLDHRLVNEIEGLANGLAESILGWLVDRFIADAKALRAETRIDLPCPWCGGQRGHVVGCPSPDDANDPRWRAHYVKSGHGKMFFEVERVDFDELSGGESLTLVKHRKSWERAR